MSILGQTKINKEKHLLLVVCTQQTTQGNKNTSTHTAEICFFLCKSRIKIQLSCSSMVLRLCVRYINPKQGFKLTCLSIFNNLVYLVNCGGVFFLFFYFFYFQRPHKSESMGDFGNP